MAGIASVGWRLVAQGWGATLQGHEVDYELAAGSRIHWQPGWLPLLTASCLRRASDGGVLPPLLSSSVRKSCFPSKICNQITERNLVYIVRDCESALC